MSGSAVSAAAACGRYLSIFPSLQQNKGRSLKIKINVIIVIRIGTSSAFVTQFQKKTIVTKWFQVFIAHKVKTEKEGSH